MTIIKLNTFGMDKVRIRPITKKDISKLARLEQKTFRDASLGTVRAMLEDAFSKTIPGASLMAEDSKGNVMGGIFVEKKITWMPKCAYIVSFFVDEKWRGKRVGAALMNGCVSALKKNGIQNITVQVSPTNNRAIEIYEKYGFKLFRLAYLKTV